MTPASWIISIKYPTKFKEQHVEIERYCELCIIQQPATYYAIMIIIHGSCDVALQTWRKWKFLCQCLEIAILSVIGARSWRIERFCRQKATTMSKRIQWNGSLILDKSGGITYVTRMFAFFTLFPSVSRGDSFLEFIESFSRPIINLLRTCCSKTIKFNGQFSLAANMSRVVISYSNYNKKHNLSFSYFLSSNPETFVTAQQGKV